MKNNWVYFSFRWFKGTEITFIWLETVASLGLWGDGPAISPSPKLSNNFTVITSHGTWHTSQVPWESGDFMALILCWKPYRNCATGWQQIGLWPGHSPRTTVWPASLLFSLFVAVINNPEWRINSYDPSKSAKNKTPSLIILRDVTCLNSKHLNIRSTRKPRFNLSPSSSDLTDVQHVLIHIYSVHCKRSFQMKVLETGSHELYERDCFTALF